MAISLAHNVCPFVTTGLKCRASPLGGLRKERRDSQNFRYTGVRAEAPPEGREPLSYVPMSSPESQQAPESWRVVLESLGQHVPAGPGKALLVAVEHMFEQQRRLEQHMFEHHKLLEQQYKSEIEVRERNMQVYMELVSAMKQQVTEAQLRLLHAKGLNDTRGLLEAMGERLATATPGTRGLKGAFLWERILQGHPSLSACVSKQLRSRANNILRHAERIYRIYDILSQHVHSGKHLATLKAKDGGTIEFHRGPLSAQQVRILECIATEAGLQIKECEDTRVL